MVLDQAANPEAQVIAPEPAADLDTVVILDFGSQYSQLITRRVREAEVYCEMLPFDAPAEKALALKPRGVILSGGPNSVYEAGAPQLPDWVIASGVPVLGICYGMQLLAHALGGRVAASQHREYGPAQIHVTAAADDRGIFTGLPDELDVWMSHGDRIETLPPGFAPVAVSANSPHAAMADARRHYLRDPVPPRGRAHAARQGTPARLPLRGLRVQRVVDRRRTSSSRRSTRSARRSARAGASSAASPVGSIHRSPPP